MEGSAELKHLEDNLINKLNELRSIMDKQRDDLAVSIRRDVVAIQLKEILESHSSFPSLKQAIEDFIADLYKNVQVVKEDNGNEVNKQE